MNHYRRQFLVIIILIFTLAACAHAYPITPTTTLPSETPTSKPTKTQTPTYPPLSTPGGTATPDARELVDKKVKEFGIDCSYFQANISPKDNWAAAACGYDSDQTLQIADQTGVVYNLKFSDYLSDYVKNRDGNPMGGLIPIHWTADEQYLFFAPYVSYDGGSTCNYGFGNGGLFRLNINDGKVSTILPLTDWMIGYFFAFSPNGRFLAYIYHSPHILDLSTGENYSFKIDENLSGNLIWSPDGSQLGFATCEIDPNDYEKTLNSTVQIITLATQEKRILKSAPGTFFRIEQGNDNSYFLISERDDNWEEGFSLYYWDTGLVITATPEQ
jgi:hypothetical protein